MCKTEFANSSNFSWMATAAQNKRQRQLLERLRLALNNLGYETGYRSDSTAYARVQRRNIQAFMRVLGLHLTEAQRQAVISNPAGATQALNQVLHQSPSANRNSPSAPI